MGGRAFGGVVDPLDLYGFARATGAEAGTDEGAGQGAGSRQRAESVAELSRHVSASYSEDAVIGGAMRHYASLGGMRSDEQQLSNGSMHGLSKRSLALLVLFAPT